MDKRIRKIVIVGGGSAGWMTASYLSKALGRDIDITLIESKKIGRIGVGEATVPTIKEQFFDFLGIPEEEWMPEAGGTYKLGIRYENWKTPLKKGGDHFYHLFGELPTVEGIPLSHFWIKNKLEGKPQPFDQSCYPATGLCELKKSPKGDGGVSKVHHAYHFDALRIADYLCDWSTERGVNHVNDEIVKAELSDDGYIKEVIGSSGKRYSAQLFIDCTGFRSQLMGHVLHEPFVSYADSLLNNSAVAINVPYSSSGSIKPFTTASALINGWVWQIPLFERYGTGYVYSDHFTTADKAESELRDFLGPQVKGVEARHINFRSGRRRRSWVKNCVSFGPASGFLEPLESTGLYFIYAALYQFLQYFPDKDFDPVLRDKFNERTAFMFDDVRDFIILHFCTSPREDTPFWRANRNELKIPDSLQQILELQKAGVPINKSYLADNSLYNNFEPSFDRFWTNSNYQSVLCGVGHLPSKPLPLLEHRPDILQKGENLFQQLDFESKKLPDELPSHQAYLKKLHPKLNV